MSRTTERVGWWLVPGLCAVPAAVSLLARTEAAVGLLSLAAGLAGTYWVSREHLDSSRLNPTHSFARWGLMGWIGALLAGSVALGAPLWLSALGWALAWRQWAVSAWKGEGPWWSTLIPAVVGFPWIYFELDAVGWWFRLTGAQVTAVVMRVLGLAVTQQGTMVLVEGVPISVDVACSGLGALQAMALAGVMLLPLNQRPTWRTVVAMGALLPAAWLANTVRIFILSWVAVTFGHDAAAGSWHSTMGWLALMVVFAVESWALSRWIEAPRKNPL